MATPKELYDAQFKKFVEEVAVLDLTEGTTTTAMKNVQIYSNISVPAADAPEPDPTPTTRWGKVKCVAASIWDNETTRTVIKTVGTFGGILTVTYATIHKDHVLERQSLAQANQRNS